MTDTTAQQPTPERALDPRNVQGDLVGFNKDNQCLVFIGFADQASGRAFLADLGPNISSAWEVRTFNQLYKQVRSRRGGDKGIIEASWTNIAVTFSGLQILGAPQTELLPGEFRDGMAARAGELGDADQSAPANWVAPFNQPQQIHAMVILASDQADDLEASYARLKARMDAHGVSELRREDGTVRPELNKGHEHFGFKDGISQPGVRGLTPSSKRGQDVIATGEFLVGHPDQDGHISGQPIAVTPPEPGQPGYGQPTPPPQPALPDWTTDGAFVVYRRLRQDVGGFNTFVAQKAAELGVAPEQLAAKLMGRWQSGAPMERVPGLPKAIDPAAADPSGAHPAVLDDQHVNNFAYQQQDADGHSVPRAAHIRKANPRDEEPPGKHESDRHRILRRGVPYGPEFQPTETPYGPDPIGDDRDRGLLFLCYQASIARGFAFIQQAWANHPDFPQTGDGHDPIISQSVPERSFNLPGATNPHLTLQRWVTTTAGEYFFSPSIPALKILAGSQ